jgi:DNA-directed RNA polymerase III subunit RPC8
MSPLGPSEREGEGERGVVAAPYVLRGTMEDAGLGPCLWWDGEGEGEGGE